jgi:hypothetical protein
MVIEGGLKKVRQTTTSVFPADKSCSLSKNILSAANE